MKGELGHIVAYGVYHIIGMYSTGVHTKHTIVGIEGEKCVYRYPTGMVIFEIICRPNGRIDHFSCG